MKLLKAIAIVTAALALLYGAGVLIQEYPAVFVGVFSVAFFAVFVGIVYSELD